MNVKQNLNNINTALFDFGDTLFRTIQYDFEKGQKALLEHLHCKNQLSSLISIQNELKYLFTERNKTIFELDFKKYLQLSLNLLNIYPETSYEEIELVFWENAYRGELFENVDNFLGKLKKNKYNIGLISNSAFSMKTLVYELKKHNIYSMFDLIISSCDYGIRKPSKYLFNIALARFKVQPVNAVYIGNKIKTDMIGAKNAGLQGLLYNPEKHKVNRKYTPFSDYADLVDLFTGLNEKV